MPYINVPKAALDGESLVEPPGEYPLRIEGTKLIKKEGKSGSLLLRLVVEGTEEPAGKKFGVFFNLGDESLWRLGLLMDACGVVPGESGFQSEDLHGARFKAVVDHEEFQGQTRNRISQFARV